MPEETAVPCAQGRFLIVRMFSGLQPYEPIWHAMQDLTDQRSESTVDQLWILQHSPVFTQGQAGKAEHLLATGDIPVVQVDRGGQVTYHGPGQLVVYCLIDIERLGIGPRKLVSLIENALIRTLSEYGLQANAKQEAPGVYIGEAKIASIGLRIRRGKSFHGLSLNVNMDLLPFNRINPCGYPNLKMIQLADYPLCESIEQVAGRLVRGVHEVFGYSEIMMEYWESI